METITREELIDLYKAELFDSYGYISLGYTTFTAGEVLQKCDPKQFEYALLAHANLRGLVIVG